MLDEEQFVRWCQQLDYGEATRKQIEHLRSTPPARRVRSSRGNVSGRYPSRKMGVTIQFESHQNELAGIYEMEYDSTVLEYYDQPPAIKLCYQAASGRRLGVWHTPDFFVLRQVAAGWEEWKTEAELVFLASKMPARYVKGEDQSWRCPPGEAYAQGMGLYYRVRTDAEINWVLQNNLHFLEDYVRSQQLVVAAEQVVGITNVVGQQPGISLGELIGLGWNRDEIYALIAQQQLHVDLLAVSIVNSGEQLQVFPWQQRGLTSSLANRDGSQETVAASNCVEISVGCSVNWNGKCLEILNMGATHTALINQEDKVIQLPNEALWELLKQGALTASNAPKPNASSINELLARASESDCAEANRRYGLIAPYLQGEQPTKPPVSESTIRRWLRAWRQAEKQYGYGYVGLLPRVRYKGNHQRKLPESTQKLMEEFIASKYHNLKQQGKFAVYSELVGACDQQGITPPSYKTFVGQVNRQPSYEQTLKRQGHKAAYKHEPVYWELEVHTPKHGNRPLEICHLDHTQLDIELVSCQTGINLGRPWATFLSDAYSRRILSVYLTFDPPSYRSCMMAIRECVRRHGRLPQTLVVDGGKEFASVYFEQLLAAYECIKKTRPGAKPRFGSVCERLFGTANTMLIYNLQGNTQSTSQVRLVTKATNPRNLAIWTLGSLYQHLGEWAYEFYDTREHPALGQSPRAAYELGLWQTGWRTHRLIAYDETFRIFTLPTTAKGTALVVPNQGVKINYIYYWHNSFRQREVEKTQVPVRYDPYDVGTAYAYVKGQWLSCISQHYSSFHGRSEREVMVASAQLRKQQKNHAKQFTVTAKALADFLAVTAAQEVCLLQQLRDVEAKAVLAIIEDGLSQHNCAQAHPEGLAVVPQPPAEVGQTACQTTADIEPYEEFW